MPNLGGSGKLLPSSLSSSCCSAPSGCQTSPVGQDAPSGSSRPRSRASTTTTTRTRPSRLRPPRPTRSPNRADAWRFGAARLPRTRAARCRSWNTCVSCGTAWSRASWPSCSAPIVAWIFYDQILTVLTGPYDKIRPELADRGIKSTAVLTGIGGAFQFQLKISLVAGILGSSPVWLWELLGVHPACVAPQREAVGLSADRYWRAPVPRRRDRRGIWCCRRHPCAREFCAQGLRNLVSGATTSTSCCGWCWCSASRPRSRWS